MARSWRGCADHAWSRCSAKHPLSTLCDNLPAGNRRCWSLDRHRAQKRGARVGATGLVASPALRSLYFRRAAAGFARLRAGITLDRARAQVLVGQCTVFYHVGAAGNRDNYLRYLTGKPGGWVVGVAWGYE